MFPDAIKFKQYVGAIQAGNLTIEILPKADRDSNTNKWHNILLAMLNECQLIKVEHPELANLQLHSNSILGAYLHLFIKELQQLLHEGLIKKYRKIDGNQSSLKGQLLFSDHVNRNVVHKERFFVRYTVYDHQHVLHKVLYKALQLVIKLATSPVVKGRAERLILNFPEMPDIKVDESLFTKIIVDRKSARYKQAILIGKMLLLNYRPDITGRSDHVLALLFA